MPRAEASVETAEGVTFYVEAETTSDPEADVDITSVYRDDTGQVVKFCALSPKEQDAVRDAVYEIDWRAERAAEILDHAEQNAEAQREMAL